MNMRSQKIFLRELLALLRNRVYSEFCVIYFYLLLTRTSRLYAFHTAFLTVLYLFFLRVMS